jgi:hypothetical protein
MVEGPTDGSVGMPLPLHPDANIRSRKTDHGHCLNTGDLPENRSDI